MCARRCTPRRPRAACATAIRLRFANKRSEPSDFALEVSGVKGATVKSVVAKRAARRSARGHASIRTRRSKSPVYVTTPRGRDGGASTPITFTATDAKTGERSVVVDHFFGP